MAIINNTETIKRILDDAGIQTAIDDVPTQLARSVVPVLVSNPRRQIIIKSNTASDSTSAIIHTTRANKDTYLTSVILSISKDVNSTSSYSAITIVPFGVANISIISSLYEPLTAGSKDINIDFNIPIKLTRGSNIEVVNGTAIATSIF